MPPIPLISASNVLLVDPKADLHLDFSFESPLWFTRRFLFFHADEFHQVHRKDLQELLLYVNQLILFDIRHDLFHVVEEKQWHSARRLLAEFLKDSIAKRYMVQ